MVSDLQQFPSDAPFQPALRNGLFSSPHFPEQPFNFPFVIAICAISLPEGCKPPQGGIGLRISSGLGQTQEEARFKALAEAAERYSIQYTPDRQQQLNPIVTLEGTAESLATCDLTLGAPVSPTPVTSIGCAAGLQIGDASRRAALELIEHLRLDAFRHGGGNFAKVDLKEVAALEEHRSFLSTQFRRLDAWQEISSAGYSVVVATTSDHDGGRTSIGSAAGEQSVETIRKACEEAIFQWRNMVEVERKGIDLTRLEEPEAQAVRFFRGAVPRDEWTSRLQATEAFPEDCLKTGIDPLAALAQLTGKRVRLFDLSLPAVAIPVVRIVTG